MARSIVIGLLVSVLLAAPCTSQQVGGWRTSSDRYTSAGDAAPAASSPPASNPYGAPAATLTPSAEITPLGAAPPAATAGGATGNMTPVTAQGTTSARVSKGPSSLPNDQGQVMRDYDIRPYTSRAVGVAKPEQVIVDWILRETGYEAWHGEPLGMLSASNHTLRVYHTPEMHAIVTDLVDRFVNRSTENYSFTLRVATVNNPNWRSRALPLMTPVPVQSPGVQGWIMPKENAAVLLNDLTRRGDYREYSSPQQLIPNGHNVVLSTMRPRSYVKGVVPMPNVWPGYQPDTGQLEEGFSMEFSPLLSQDGKTADAVVKLRLQQVEKMVPIMLDVPTPVAQNQRMQVEVPQMTMANMNERFRWPADQVLILSMGVIATPAPAKGNAITDALPMLKSPPRADALLIVESKGFVTPPVAAPTGPAASTATRPMPSFQGRY